MAISKGTVLQFCEDYKQIENYDEAIKDESQTWICHHRLEVCNSDGVERPVCLSSDELKALGVYYDRPPNELIFVTKSEHGRIHGKYATWFVKHGSDNYFAQHKFVGEDNHMYGKKHTSEARRKMSEAAKVRFSNSRGTFYGKKHSDESKRRMSEARRARGTGYKQINRTKRHWRRREDGSQEWY